MRNFLKISNISFKMLLIATFTYFVNYIFNGIIFNYLSLVPSLVVNDFQLWRILSFPLAGTSLESYILFFLTFTIISPNLEKSFKKPYYFFFISLLICLQGAASIIFHYNTELNFFGTEGISFFVITLFVLMNNKKKLQFSRMNPIKTTNFALIISIFWLISVASHSYLQNNFNIINLSTFSAAYGIIAGLMIFIEMKIIAYFKNLRKIDAPRNFDIPKPEELAMAYSKPKIEMSRMNEILRDSKSLNDIFDDEDFTEEHLNAILDKMNELGSGSLTEYEIEYLKEYSNRIN